MPIYEYECNACKDRHEIIQRFSDAPLTHCPKCGGELRKLFSSPAIQFKGSGFYKTDYATNGKPETRNQKPENQKPENQKPENQKPENQKPESQNTETGSQKSGT